MTNTVEETSNNEPWRYNNRANTATRQDTQTHMTRQSSCNNFQYNSPNLSDNWQEVTCYRCGELGHIKADCKERVYCTTCRSAHHDTKACRNSTPSPPNNHIPTGYHPTVTSPPLIRYNNRRSTNTTDLHRKWTLPSKPIGKPNSQKQHGTKPPVQQSITSPISQHDRSIYTDPNTRHRQQEQ